jgi:outer membrane receptor protein involved in Fe transport
MSIGNTLTRPSAAALALAACCTLPAVAQETGVITGRAVARATGEPISSASIMVLRTSARTVTDADGEYTLPDVPIGSRVLEVSVAGYGTVTHRVTVLADDTTRLDFELLPLAVDPEVTLYSAGNRSTRRREVGYTVAVIGAHELEAPGVTTIGEALQGRVPGLLVLNSSGLSGVGQQYHLRGMGTWLWTDRPLVLVDGVRVAGLPYPEGMGMNQAPDPLDDIDPATIERIEIVRGPAAAALYGEPSAGGVIHVFTKRGTRGGHHWSVQVDQGTEWLGHVGPERGVNPTGLGLNDCRAEPGCPASGSWLRDAHEQRYRASLRGGIPLAGYFVSGKWARDGGVIAQQGSDDWSWRGNVDLRPLPSLELGLSTSHAQRAFRWFPGSFLSSILRGDEAAVTADDGWLLDFDPQQNTRHTTWAATVAWTPFAGWRQRLLVGRDLADSESWAERLATGATGSPEQRRTDEWWELRTNTFRYTGTGAVALGDEVRSQLTWGVQAHDQTLTDSMRAGSLDTDLYFSQSWHSEVHTRGLFAHLRLGLWERLFVGGGVRWHDARNWDTVGMTAFPAAEVAYLISEHGFWPGWWESLQLRFAWGRSAQPPRAVRLREDLLAFAPVGTELPVVRPERPREFEIGFQSSMLDGRVTLEYTYYDQRTNDVIARARAPAPSAVSSVASNRGAISNRGHELLADVAVLRGPAVTWNVGVRWSTNHSEALGVGDRRVIEADESVPRSMEDGLPVPSYYGLRVVTNPTDVGVPPVIENRSIGPVYPTFAFGLSTRLTLGGSIVLDVLGEGQGGHFLASGTAWTNSRLGTWPECIPVQEKLDAGDVSDLTAWQQVACNPNITTAADWTFPADFFRLRRASLTYRLPDRWLPAVERASITVAARNPFLITDYPGLDPEAISGGSSDMGEGDAHRIERYELPPTTSLSLGIRLEF